MSSLCLSVCSPPAIKSLGSNTGQRSPSPASRCISTTGCMHVGHGRLPCSAVGSSVTLCLREDVARMLCNILSKVQCNGMISIMTFFPWYLANVVSYAWCYKLSLMRRRCSGSTSPGRLWGAGRYILEWWFLWSFHCRQWLFLLHLFARRHRRSASSLWWELKPASRHTW